MWEAETDEVKNEAYMLVLGGRRHLKSRQHGRVHITTHRISTSPTLSQTSDSDLL
jgi:hypothetical protein